MQNYWEKNYNVVKEVFDEDFEIGEAIQFGLGTNANENFIFGKYENLYSLSAAISEYGPFDFILAADYHDLLNSMKFVSENSLFSSRNFSNTIFLSKKFSMTPFSEDVTNITTPRVRDELSVIIRD